MIDLYTADTPNGHKVSIALEELSLAYEVHALDLAKSEQKSAAYLAINPNGRIPAIVDRDTSITMFESGAILMYLAEKTGRLLPTALADRYNVIQWLMFQMSGVGPMMGQANVFTRYFPEQLPSVQARYRNESRRLLTVVDTQLAKTEWLAGAFSIADIATWPWARAYHWGEIDISGLPNLARWMAAMAARPACIAGIAVPSGPKLTDDERVMAAQQLITR